MHVSCPGGEFPAGFLISVHLSCAEAGVTGDEATTANVNAMTIVPLRVYLFS